jgi:thymidine kinase
MLTVIMGCMFAQKTTELLRLIRRYRSIGFKVLVVNYKHDTRYGDNVIASHDLDTVPAIAVERLAELDEETVKGYDVVVIDEGQFFGDLFDKVTGWVDLHAKLHVVVSGLDGDAERRPFGDMLRLIPHAEHLLRLSSYCAVCRDGTAAHFSKKVAGDKGQLEDVGGADKYLPVCRKHYNTQITYN